MTVAWPAALSSPTANGLSGGGFDTRTKTQMDDGKTRTINRAVNTLHIYQLTWILTEQQRSIFKSFYQFDMNDGVNWVTADWLAVLGHSSHAFIMPDYDITKTGGVYQLSALIQVLPAAVIVDAEITSYPVSGAAA